MKNYKQILEAINKGIQLALDDMEDIEDNSSISQTNDIIDAEDVIENHIMIRKWCVDLGLPSRTLWHKYNLGVNPDYLSSSLFWYGNQYAWGETKEKLSNQLFNWENYKYCNNSPTSLTKYCPRGEKHQWVWDWSDSNVKRTPPDGKCKLELSDDAAYQTNNKWRIPTKEDFEELLENVTNKHVIEYNGIVGLEGIEFTSKINGNKIFFPLIREHNQIRAYHWTNQISKQTPFESIAFYIDDFVEPRIISTNRCFGCFIRPIIKR